MKIIPARRVIRLIARVVLYVGFGVFQARHVSATETKLISSDSKTFDNFGCAVSTNGTMAIVGAYSKQGVLGDDGAVYVFVRSGSTWAAPYRLLPDVPGWPSRHFGAAVAMDGTTAVVGAPWATDGGSAYVFYHDGSGWTQQSRLVGSPTDSGENFGRSVAISGDTVIVGANYEDHGTVQSAGAAYVFKRSGTVWSKQARLISSDAQANQWFGYSVAVSGDTAVVGGHPVSGATAGWAYVFQRSGSTWTQRERLTESDSSDAIAVDDRTVVVGDKWDWNVGVYAYQDTSVAGDWSSLNTTRIGAAQTHAGDFFGSALAIDGDTLVVGAESASSGAAYRYKWNGSTWTLDKTLIASDGAFADNFGVSVAISGNITIVGADMADGGDSSSGAAYAYQIGPPPTPTASPTPTPTPTPSKSELINAILGKGNIINGDVNGDGKVDVADLVWLILEK